MKKLVLIFVVTVAALEAQKFNNQSSELAYLVAESANKAAPIFDPMNDTVKVFKSVAKNNVVIHSRQELTKTKAQLLQIRSRYEEKHNEIGCSFSSEILSRGVEIYTRTYDKNNHLAFTIKMQCQ